MIYRAAVDVNEEGTEAAAAIGVPMPIGELLPKPVEVYAARPFIFLADRRHPVHRPPDRVAVRRH